MENSTEELRKNIRECRLCADEMDREPNPIVQIDAGARVMIAGQAPGNRADLSGVPFDDPSGDRLRDWMQIDRATFYDASAVSIVPMGFCFPGNDKNGGDKPPFRRCSKQWRAEVMAHLEQVEVTLLVGRYAQVWHLGDDCLSTLTETVKSWTTYARYNVFTLPHPSWRNTAWLKRNPWFELEVLPTMRHRIHAALGLLR